MKNVQRYMVLLIIGKDVKNIIFFMKIISFCECNVL